MRVDVEELEYVGMREDVPELRTRGRLGEGMLYEIGGTLLRRKFRACS